VRTKLTRATVCALPPSQVGRAAGPIRNRAMLVAAQPHHVVAFVGATSRGTWDALKIVREYAKEAGSSLRSVLLVVQDARHNITTSVWTAQRFCHAILTPEQPHEAKEVQQSVPVPLVPAQPGQTLLGFKRIASSDMDHNAKRTLH
jgi:hypothetical protein